MRKSNWITVAVVIAIWAVLPRGVARAQEAIGDIDFYVNYSTGVSPFTWTTVNPNSGIEQQVTCNDGDVAIAGGYEVENLPPPKGVVVTVPQDQFYFSGDTPIGWMVFLQNTNLNFYCNLAKQGTPYCPTVQFRVSVSCISPAAFSCAIPDEC
ncbi:MAG TPA: hypothetical protein VMU41_02930 [Candidatus Binataceae bacterium]|nr:hypothetical protein [Candidatus Binataceae bacterium]